MTTFKERHYGDTIRINKLGLTCDDPGCTERGEFVSWRDMIAEDRPDEIEEPDGWALIHHRASSSSTLYFGPFYSLEEAAAWRTTQPGVQGSIVPLYRTVNWRR